jgi:hypothetical protein
MLPFYFNFATDHRGFFCDISTEWLFARITPDVTKSTMRRFTTSRAPRCNKYLDNLEEFMDKAKLSQAVDTLKQQLQQHLKESNF